MIGEEETWIEYRAHFSFLKMIDTMLQRRVYDFVQHLNLHTARTIRVVFNSSSSAEI